MQENRKEDEGRSQHLGQGTLIRHTRFRTFDLLSSGLRVHEEVKSAGDPVLQVLAAHMCQVH